MCLFALLLAPGSHSLFCPLNSSIIMKVVRIPERILFTPTSGFDVNPEGVVVNPSRLRDIFMKLRVLEQDGMYGFGCTNVFSNYYSPCRDVKHLLVCSENESTLDFVTACDEGVERFFSLGDDELVLACPDEVDMSLVLRSLRLDVIELYFFIVSKDTVFDDNTNYYCMEEVHPCEFCLSSYLLFC
jgi:hypothetical protein